MAVSKTGAVPAEVVTASKPGEQHPSLAVLVEDLHVSYRVYKHRRPRMRELLTNRLRSREFREIQAVHGVSLEARVGEVVGLIGMNGSGKTTLLKAIAGLLPPTAGAVYARSQPRLLGVSAVLNKQLSGRDNIYLGCLALGMSRRETDARYDDIVKFAGVEDFIDIPMKAYSSGMRARLHFSIATAVAPEILLIDEALAVGDKQFKKRSLERLDEVRSQAGTIFLVTHTLPEIERVCDRVVWLSKGRVMMEGKPDEVIAAYSASEDE